MYRDQEERSSGALRDCVDLPPRFPVRLRCSKVSFEFIILAERLRCSGVQASFAILMFLFPFARQTSRDTFADQVGIVRPSLVTEQVGEAPLNVAGGLVVTHQLEEDLHGSRFACGFISLGQGLVVSDAAPDLAADDLIKRVSSGIFFPHDQFSNRPGERVNVGASTFRWRFEERARCSLAPDRIESRKLFFQDARYSTAARTQAELLVSAALAL